MPQNIWTSGTWNVICQVCGFKYKANEIKHRWDGLIVCEADFEHRHSGDLFQARDEKIGVPFTRPEAVDSFTTVTYAADQGEAIPTGTFDNSL